MNKNTKDIQELVRNRFVNDCYSIKDFERSSKSINYLYASNGIFEVRKNEIGTFSIKDKENKNKSTFNYNEYVLLSIPKIPELELYKIKKFFRYISINFKNSEAMVQIFWNKKEKKYFSICLEQVVSKKSVHYKRNLEIEQNKNYILVMDIHSHNKMSAFFSETDNRDEIETRFYGVIGKVNSPKMEVKFRYSVAGKFRNISKEDIFNTDKLNIEQVNFPKEWINKINKCNYYNINNNKSNPITKDLPVYLL